MKESYNESEVVVLRKVPGESYILVNNKIDGKILIRKVENQKHEELKSEAQSKQ